MQAPDETGALLRRLVVHAQDSRTHVLVADDDVAVRQIIVRSLEQLGHRVTAVSNGEDALARLEKNHPFDLVILDAMMPRVDGFTACESLRADPDNNRLPILLVTALADKRSRLRAHECGANEFISKPVDRMELVTRVDHQLKLRDYEALQREYAAKLENEVATLTQTLFRSERLAFLGTLAGGVGHELNNLTTVMQTALYLVNRDIEEGKVPDPDSITDLESVLSHLKNHGKQLLNLGRPAIRGNTVANLNTTLKSCIQTLNMTGRTKFVDVDVTGADSQVYVGLPVERLEQIFYNLIGNAADAVEHQRDKGRIEIRISRKSGGSADMFTDDVVTVEIADNGPGISDENIDRIFEPYFTTKGPEAGTGLGLVVVRQIVAMFGGRIDVKTEKDVGTRFVMSFNVTDAPLAFANSDF